jgi:hypothetical protein
MFVTAFLVHNSFPSQKREKQTILKVLSRGYPPYFGRKESCVHFAKTVLEREMAW